MRGEVRPLSDDEIRSPSPRLATALQELAKLAMPELGDDGTCSDHPTFESVCFSPDFRYTPTRRVDGSPELCGKVEELQTRLSAVSEPD